MRIHEMRFRAANDDNDSNNAGASTYVATALKIGGEGGVKAEIIGEVSVVLVAIAVQHWTYSLLA